MAMLFVAVKHSAAADWLKMRLQIKSRNVYTETAIKLAARISYEKIFKWFKFSLHSQSKHNHVEHEPQQNLVSCRGSCISVT